MGQRTARLIQATDSTDEEQDIRTHLGLTATRMATRMKRSRTYSYDNAWRVSKVQLSATDGSVPRVTEGYATTR